MELIINELQQKQNSVATVKNYYRYKSMEELNSAVRGKRRPISVVIISSGDMYACIQSDSLCMIKVVEYFSQCCGLHYFICFNTNVMIETSVKSLNIDHFGLLLPLLVVKKVETEEALDDNMGIFSLITSEWKEMSKDKEIK